MTRELKRPPPLLLESSWKVVSKQDDYQKAGIYTKINDHQIEIEASVSDVKEERERKKLGVGGMVVKKRGKTRKISKCAVGKFNSDERNYK